jgi:predicted HicB family RNase H-like nuclease
MARLRKESEALHAIAIRVEPELRKLVEKAAAADDRSVASYVKKALTDKLRRAGYLKKDEEPSE